MAFATIDEFVAALESPRDRVLITKDLTCNAAGRVHSSWLGLPNAGAAPTTAVAPTKATTGAYPFDGWQNSGGGLKTYCVGGDVRGNQASGSQFGLPTMMIVADRLSHQGGLSGVVTGAQTTNLPTAALTRYTSGVGVMAALEIYTAIGSSSTSVTVSYTNTTPTAGQISPAIQWGTTGFREISRFFPLPLAAGDIGVTSVESVTVPASTSTAGAFGVTLYKPLFAIAVSPFDSQVDAIFSGRMAGGLPEILDDACLFLIGCPGIAATHRIQGSLSFAEV